MPQRRDQRGASNGEKHGSSQPKNRVEASPNQHQNTQGSEGIVQNHVTQEDEEHLEMIAALAQTDSVHQNVL